MRDTAKLDLKRYGGTRRRYVQPIRYSILQHLLGLCRMQWVEPGMLYERFGNDLSPCIEQAEQPGILNNLCAIDSGMTRLRHARQDCRMQAEINVHRYCVFVLAPRRRNGSVNHRNYRHLQLCCNPEQQAEIAIVHISRNSHHQSVTLVAYGLPNLFQLTANQIRAAEMLKLSVSKRRSL